MMVLLGLAVHHGLTVYLQPDGLQQLLVVCQTTCDKCLA